jgi:hypothetical protein
VVRPRGDVATDVAARAPLVGHGTPWRILGPGGRLAAIARLEGGRLHPEKVFVTVEPTGSAEPASS